MFCGLKMVSYKCVCTWREREGGFETEELPKASVGQMF